MFGKKLFECMSIIQLDIHNRIDVSSYQLILLRSIITLVIL